MSRYIIFFQLGAIADRRVARDSFAYLDRLWRRWSPDGVPDDDHRDRVKATIARSMPAPIAMYRGGGFAIGEEPIAVPTPFIAGEADGCVLPQMSDGQERLFSRGYERELWSGTGHFPHREQTRRTASVGDAWFSRFSP